MRDGGRGAALTRDPFTDDAETSLEAVRPQSAPEFCAIATTVQPMLLQQREPRSKAALSQPENVLSFATEDAPDQTPAQTSDPGDRLDGYSFGAHAPDQHVGFLAPMKTFKL